jgi:PadR family transcriptional regulator PadR
MPRRVNFSAQTVAVLSAFAGEPSSWRHGYDLASETGLKSGTLYPILVRLADRGIVEASWETEQPAGRPRRHLYRLTSKGLAAATTAVAAAGLKAGRTARSPDRVPQLAPAPRRSPGPRRLAGEET